MDTIFTTVDNVIDTLHAAAIWWTTSGGLLPTWVFPVVAALLGFYAALWLALDSLARFPERDQN